MTATTLPGVLLSGTHAARPAASAVASGSLYAETDTGQTYQSDGSSTWTAWGAVAGGTGMTNPMTTTGDMIYSSSGSTPARLAIAASGYALMGGTAPGWALPPGHEFDYVEITSSTTVSATTEGGATTSITGGAVTYDGATIVKIEVYYEYVNILAGAGKGGYIVLYDGSSSIGVMAYTANTSGTQDLYQGPVYAARRLTPSNASHTYSIRLYKDSGGTVVFSAGAGGTGAGMPAFMRITKV